MHILYQVLFLLFSHTYIILARSGISRGSPNERMVKDNRVKRIDRSLLPTPNEIVQQYRQSGGHITEFCSFGSDPIANNLNKCIVRNTSFSQCYPSFDAIFHQLVNGNETLFREGLLYYIDITYRLSLS